MDVLDIFDLAQQEADDLAEGRGFRQIRVFRDRINPLEEYRNTEFIARFRFTKDICESSGYAAIGSTGTCCSVTETFFLN